MKEKYVLLGGSGYVGQAFVQELSRRGLDYVNVARAETDYTKYPILVQLLRDEQATFLINCAGYTGRPNVDACERNQADTILGNVVLSQTIADACEAAGVAWGQVSSGCIYTGAKLRLPGQPERIERDLMLPHVRKLWQADPTILYGFSESDEPNFSFRRPPCSFYSGVKSLSEEVLSGRGRLYIWRLRIPFDHLHGPRNFLTKIMSYPRLYDNVNSLSHRGEFARICLDLWEKRVPFGTYNVTNPGWVTTRQVAEMLRARLGIQRPFDYFADDNEFYQAAVAPRSNTILDTSKIEAADVGVRSVEEALEDALSHWQP